MASAEEVISHGTNFLENEGVDEYCKRVMTVIKECQKQSNELQGWQHYSDFSGVNFTMTRMNRLLHSLLSKIFIHQDVKLDINGYKLSDQFDIIKEGNDALCEKINCDLDEASGIRKEINTDILDTTMRVIRGPVNQNSNQNVVLTASRNVQKPQLFFSPKIDNSYKTPFIPTIKDKPNSLKPLSVMICLDPDGNEYYSHPYEYELEHWSPPKERLTKRVPKPYLPLEETELIYVDTEEQLNAMVQELFREKEIAVDLEHHNFRSYLGLTCLIQISSRNKDFIIDPFPLRNQLNVLNEIFTNPKITKVFHGADQDVFWLQRDFGVYIVNMFDTHQAAIVLEYPQRSLASILQSLCKVTVNKTYQRADWRIRPLPEDFLHYGRLDTHYLLYVYDILTNELIEKGGKMNNLLHATYQRSKEICLKRFEKPILGPDTHMKEYRKSRKTFNTRQMFALQQLYQWRDRIARQQDESVDYVLPRHMMFQIADVLPKEFQGILACCNPIPSLVKTEQLTILQIVRAARNLPLDQISLSLEQLPTSIANNQSSLMRDLKSVLISKYDLSAIEEDPPGLDTLLSPRGSLLGDLFEEKTEVPVKKRSHLFGTFKDHLKCQRSLLSRKTTEFMSPFERYKVFLANRPDEVESSSQQSAAEKDNMDRIQKVREHFLSLTQSSASDTDRAEETGSSYSDRLQRLQDHIAALMAPKTLSDAPREVKKKEVDQSDSPTFSPSNTKSVNTQKRKSSEGHSGSSVKKLKEEEEEEGELPSSDSSEDDADSPEEKFEAFDYNNADYNVFRPPVSRKRGGRRVKERFRGKGSQNPRGMKKSGNRSMSWSSRNSY